MTSDCSELKNDACGKIFAPKTKIGDECESDPECIESNCRENKETCVSKCIVLIKENEVCNQMDKVCEDDLICAKQQDNSYKCVVPEVAPKKNAPKIGDVCAIVENTESECGSPERDGLYCNAETMKCAQVQIAALGEECVVDYFYSKALCKDRSSLNYCEQTGEEAVGVCKASSKLGDDCAKTAGHCQWEGMCAFKVSGDAAQGSICKKWLGLGDTCTAVAGDIRCNPFSGLECSEGKCVERVYEQEMCMVEEK